MRPHPAHAHAMRHTLDEKSYAILNSYLSAAANFIVWRRHHDIESTKGDPIMNEITSKYARRLSRLGQRAVFGMAVMDAAKENPNLMALVADVASSAGLERMKSELPGQILDTGIAEQNMMGMAAGLASEGFEVVTATFAPFQSMRCLEQIRVNFGYMGLKVIMAGLASGVAYGELGYTHCCIEDVSIMRSIPGIAVVSPADCVEVVKAFEAALKDETSVYIRLTGKANTPIVYTEDYDFKIGKGVILREGGEILLITNGLTVHTCLEAADRLAGSGISAEVINMHTVKPFDSELLKSRLAGKSLVVTIEEHELIGGLGDAVAACLSELSSHPRLIRIGHPNAYGKAAHQEALLPFYGLDANGIIQKIVDSSTSLGA